MSSLSMEDGTESNSSHQSNSSSTASRSGKINAAFDFLILHKMFKYCYM